MENGEEVKGEEADEDKDVKSEEAEDKDVEGEEAVEDNDV